LCVGEEGEHGIQLVCRRHDMVAENINVKKTILEDGGINGEPGASLTDI